MAADVCDGIDLKWMNEDSGDEDNAVSLPAKKVMQQNLSFRERIRRIVFRNSKARLGGTVFDMVVKVVMCLLYIGRVMIDEYEEYACGGIPCDENSTFVTPKNEDDGMAFSSAEVNWHVLLWIYRPLPLWIAQVLLASATFFKALLYILVAKGNRCEYFTQPGFFLEFTCSFPFLITLGYHEMLKDLYVPCFLNCWLAKMALERFFNDIHMRGQRFQTISVTMSQQLLLLIATLCCLIFTTVCGIQHIQRASSEKPLTMFESFYFVIVTFSTVGYGDISPDIWLGQLFMVLMICIAIAFIPRQIEIIASTWAEKNRAGGEYGRRTARKQKHVVVCSKVLTADAIMDFLSEFYAHPKLEHYIVILLSSTELDSNMQTILRDPKWANRVIFMRGSALKNVDLRRCRMNDAEACFILAPGNCSNKDQADQHTILRSWAIKDFSPSCNQYIQIFRAENKMHVKFAEHVVCEDEFKYALLANNCLYPGLSTLVSLLVHTSAPYDGNLASEWMKLYGAHSGNEIYHIQLGKSVFFKEYEGKSFTEASCEAHAIYGVTLMGVMEVPESESLANKPKLLLNPGPQYILKATDFCFYLSFTKEEEYVFKPEKTNIKKEKQDSHSSREQSYKKMAENLHRIMDAHLLEDDFDGEESVFNTITSQVGEEYSRAARSLHVPDTPDVLQPSLDESDASHRVHITKNHLWLYEDMGHEEFIKGPPPTFLTGSRKTICHLVKHRRNDCCLLWGEQCSHVSYKHVNDNRWQHQLIIIAAEQFCLGLYNFIIPLRSEFISIKSLSPIIIMLENDPDDIFLETIAQFPMVYWMKGKMKNIDDLIRAGITKSSHVVVVNRSSNMDVEEVLVDSDTIVAVQMVFKLFPHTNIITEISKTSNMKFMQFEPHDEYSQRIARLEKKLSESMKSSLTHIFRLPFAAGNVFSGSMLDTLLYQTFVKGYLIKFVRLLLGIDAEQNSGHLSSIKVKRDIQRKYRTYGDLYKGLCSVTGEVPIAIYRTEVRKRTPDMDETDQSDNNNRTKHNARMLKKTSFSMKPFYERAEQNDISDLIRNRLKSQSIDTSHYSKYT
ncbi:hypothetical protein FSP39_012694 [Pinctada imbricata]|uniref:RCK N-terminal domain-containing protein n=1 Tax=Pinctada imbricata TaxID=66713 RepID=A0AA89BUK7_PINIB|nr:hypothetical protein FSP39_012694 [Pinctada imbricata]